jgi:hypothetical protein
MKKIAPDSASLAALELEFKALQRQMKKLRKAKE